MLYRPYPRRRVLRLLGVAALGLLVRPAPAATRVGERYVCTNDECTPYYYDPALGDPEQDVPAGTPFAEVPRDWICPVCGWTKSKFVPESQYAP